MLNILSISRLGICTSAKRSVKTNCSKLLNLGNMNSVFHVNSPSWFGKSATSTHFFPLSIDTCLWTEPSVGRWIFTLAIFESLLCLNCSKSRCGLTLIVDWFGMVSCPLLMYFFSVSGFTCFRLTSLIIISSFAKRSSVMSSKSLACSGFTVAITSTLFPFVRVEKLNLLAMSTPFCIIEIIFSIFKFGNCTSAKWSVKTNCSRLLYLGNVNSVFHV